MSDKSCVEQSGIPAKMEVLDRDRVRGLHLHLHYHPDPGDDALLSGRPEILYSPTTVGLRAHAQEDMIQVCAFI